jgi:hypothetical protein
LGAGCGEVPRLTSPLPDSEAQFQGELHLARYGYGTENRSCVAHWRPAGVGEDHIAPASGSGWVAGIVGSGKIRMVKHVKQLRTKLQLGFLTKAYVFPQGDILSEETGGSQDVPGRVAEEAGGRQGKSSGIIPPGRFTRDSVPLIAPVVERPSPGWSSNGPSCQFARVGTGRHVLVPNCLQVNHCRSEVLVTHLILPRLDVADLILQVARISTIWAKHGHNPPFVKSSVATQSKALFT